jgi:hypothetical protein
MRHRAAAPSGEDVAPGPIGQEVVWGPRSHAHSHWRAAERIPASRQAAHVRRQGQLSETAERATTSAGNSIDDVKSTLAQRRTGWSGALQDVTQYTRTQPLSALAIAAGLGLLVGRFAARTPREASRSPLSESGVHDSGTGVALRPRDLAGRARHMRHASDEVTSGAGHDTSNSRPSPEPPGVGHALAMIGLVSSPHVDTVLLPSLTSSVPGSYSRRGDYSAQILNLTSAPTRRRFW